VLGATGFIGGHIAKQALDVGWKVHGFRRNPGAVGHLQDRDIHWIEGNLEHPSSVQRAMQRMDFVFHAAGYFPADQNPHHTPDHIKIAAGQMENITRAAQDGGVRRLIYTSSLTTIGSPPPDQDRLADERDFYQTGSLPDNGYYESKSVMETIALQKAAQGMDIVILNPTTVLGPGDIHVRTGRILVMLAQGKLKAAPPGWINLVDVRDVAAAHINAARSGKKGERYILGGENYPLPKAARILADLVDVNPPLFTLPPWSIDTYIQLSDRMPFLPYVPFHLRAYRHWQGVNPEKAIQQLKLSSRFLEETVRDSLRWFHNQGVL
jgi:dihydroflavonol-4-reductase